MHERTIAEGDTAARGAGPRSSPGTPGLGPALLAAAAAAPERFGLGLYGDSSISIGFVFLLASATEYGTEGVLVVGPLMALAGHSFRSLPLSRLVYNAAVTTLGGLAAS